jgi:hypothetical protein
MTADTAFALSGGKAASHATPYCVRDTASDKQWRVLLEIDLRDVHLVTVVQWHPDGRLYAAATSRARAASASSLRDASFVHVYVERKRKEAHGYCDSWTDGTFARIIDA